MRADNSTHLAESARRRRAATVARATTTIEAAEAAGTRVSVTDLARQASVSRAWLYAERGLRERIQLLAAMGKPTAEQSVPINQRASAASLQNRLELANRRVKALMVENRRLTDELQSALGAARASR